MPDIFDQISLEETLKGDIFDQLEFSTQSKISEPLRHIARTGSRIGESLLGLPADILKTAQLGARGLEKSASKIRETIGLSPLESKEKPPGLPGSSELKDISTKLFGETVTAQSPEESFIDDVVSDAAVLAIPVKGKIPFMRSIGTALAGNLAAKGAEKAGFEEKGQTVAKLGAFFLSGLAGKGNLKKYWTEQYKKAEEAVPKGSRLEADKLESQLNKLERSLKRGGIETPSQKFVEKPLKQIQDIIHNGEMRVEDAIAAKKKINELRSSLFDEVKGKAGQKYARTRINDVANYLDEAIENYGKSNPEFFDAYKSANEAYGGYQQSRRVGNWISRNIPFGKLGKTGLIILEGLFKPASLKATVPGYALFKSGELFTRMFKNQTLRKYYGNLIKNAINENKTGVLKNIKNIENEIKESDPDLFDELTREYNSNK